MREPRLGDRYSFWSQHLDWGNLNDKLNLSKWKGILAELPDEKKFSDGKYIHSP